MTLEELLAVMQNRLITLNEARKTAFTAGDLDRINQIDGDLLTTATTILQLRTAITTATQSP